MARTEPPADDPASDDDLVFRALADRSRRLLLDRLRERDGQSLGALGAALPTMTRFGVAKHLALLEAAGLVTTRKVGRERVHYLNPVPIRLVYERWVSQYSEPFVTVMARLKSGLERESGPIEHPELGAAG